MMIVKLLMNGFAISCPIPSGIFVPMFFIGSITGRIYGIFMNYIFGITSIGMILLL